MGFQRLIAQERGVLELAYLRRLLWPENGGVRVPIFEPQSRLDL